MMKTSRAEYGQQIVAAYGNTCFYCDEPFGPDLKLTIDHFFPQSKARELGWTEDQIWDISNLRPACRPCNVLKGDILPNEDGTVTLPERRIRAQKGPRVEVTECCNSGRLIWPGQRCQTCGSPAMPSDAPKAIQVDPKDCDHGEFHCWYCHLGYVERTSAAWWLLMGESDDSSVLPEGP